MLAKIASDLNKPDGQYTLKPAAVAAFMETLPARKIAGIGEVTAKRLAEELGVETCGQLQSYTRAQLRERLGKFGAELFDRCRGVDGRAVEPNRIRKSLSNENTFDTNLTSLEACEERLQEIHADLLQDLAKQGTERVVAKLFVKLRFADFTHTTVERGGTVPTLEAYHALLAEGWQRREEKQRIVRLLGVGVRFQEKAVVADLPREQLVLEALSSRWLVSPKNGAESRRSPCRSRAERAAPFAVLDRRFAARLSRRERYIVWRPGRWSIGSSTHEHPPYPVARAGSDGA